MPNLSNHKYHEAIENIMKVLSDDMPVAISENNLITVISLEDFPNGETKKIKSNLEQKSFRTFFQEATDKDSMLALVTIGQNDDAKIKIFKGNNNVSHNQFPSSIRFEANEILIKDDNLSWKEISLDDLEKMCLNSENSFGLS